MNRLSSCLATSGSFEDVTAENRVCQVGYNKGPLYTFPAKLNCCAQALVPPDTSAAILHKAPQPAPKQSKSRKVSVLLVRETCIVARGPFNVLICLWRPKRQMIASCRSLPQKKSRNTKAFGEDSGAVRGKAWSTLPASGLGGILKWFVYLCALRSTESCASAAPSSSQEAAPSPSRDTAPSPSEEAFASPSREAVASPSTDAAPSPSPATPKPPVTTLSVLANLLVRMQQQNASQEETQPIVDALAQILANNAGTPVPLPSPTKPTSPPPKSHATMATAQAVATEMATPQATATATAIPPALAAAVPPPAVKPKPEASASTNRLPLDTRCNSKSHESEYRAFSRFCESNPKAVELRKAFEPDPETCEL